MEDKVTKSNRHAAGQDPAKREAILNGAGYVFMESGFDAASVNDICRAADVSKSTLYVYFNSKEDLFEALVERERERLFEDLELSLHSDLPLREKLYDFSFSFSKMICSQKVIKSERIVIAMAERMPELSARYYNNGPLKMRRRIQRFLEGEVAKGALEIQDTTLASHQLLVLSTAGLWRQSLFKKMPDPPPDDKILMTSRSAVDVFLSIYLKR